MLAPRQSKPLSFTEYRLSLLCQGRPPKKYIEIEEGRDKTKLTRLKLLGGQSHEFRAKTFYSIHNPTDRSIGIYLTLYK